MCVDLKKLTKQERLQKFGQGVGLNIYPPPNHSFYLIRGA